tara:strand:- start:2097 stop:2519 length:423 start_codon:yes stop_codon:yes gene_type:complete
MDYKKILKNLPYDIKDKILNFYYKKSNSYKESLKNFYNINRYPYFVKLCKVIKTYKSQENYQPWHHLLYENFSKKKAERYVNSLSFCNCCKRHQQKKPTTLTDRFQYPFNINKPANFYDNPNMCKCTCRHVSRALCLVYH